MIDILIPTYNRASCLKKNILLLNKQINDGDLNDRFRIIVSNNQSTDDTRQLLEEISSSISVHLVVHHQETNIGLERNAVFLLKNATSDYVMYIGDDDYVPDGYLNFVIEKISNETAHCIIPGFSALFPDGTIKPARHAAFPYKRYEPGFTTVCRISHYGHQLSGLLTRREGLYESYMEQEMNRNLYPFIYFVTHCMLTGPTYYAPQYQVLVSQGNAKDWSYDDSGLLTDVFKNYNTAFPKNPLKAAIASILFSRNQSWRLRVGKNPLDAIRSFIYLTRSKEVSPLVKASLIGLYPYCYFEKALVILMKRLRRGAST